MTEQVPDFGGAINKRSDQSAAIRRKRQPDACTVIHGPITKRETGNLALRCQIPSFNHVPDAFADEHPAIRRNPQLQDLVRSCKPAERRDWAQSARVVQSDPAILTAQGDCSSAGCKRDSHDIRRAERRPGGLLPVVKFSRLEL
jgi:hypothetical protein